MTAQPVDRATTNARIARAVRAAMAARGVKDDKQLAALSGVKYDTLLRRLNGKPWLADEIIAVAAALDVDVSTLLYGDPDEWFRPTRGKVQPTAPYVASRATMGTIHRNKTTHGSAVGALRASAA